MGLYEEVRSGREVCDGVEGHAVGQRGSSEMCG